ncbi:GT47 Hydroxynaphthalene reductase-like protein Arp2 [Coccomyxa sp. Obi]|nr:GT47 Hydroxynaphthalene reductase-like protein Arp2 [Coccomyxa sp. Obi]
MDQKVALVTGGTRGIGFGISTVLASQGYSLVLGYNSNHDAAKEAKGELESKFGVRVIAVAGDISVPATLIALFQAVKDHFDGHLTAFIHNAGLYVGITTTSAEAPARLEPDEPWVDRVYDYYQKVYPRAFRKGLELALQCKGLQHVIAISSPGCNCNQPAMPGYEEPGQAKASMEFLVRVFAKKLAKDGINVNCIIPGFIRTGAWENVFKGKDGMRSAVEERVLRDTPAQRWAEPIEIGEVAAFLCSDRASFLTGVAIPVDGGLHLGKLQ